MIIEEEQKVEVVEDSTQTEKKEEFKQIPNDNLEKKSNRWIIVICIFLLSFLVILIGIFGAFSLYNYSKSSTISQGIYINGIDMSNLTKQEATQKLKNYYSDKLSNDITLTRNGYTAYIKASEINLSCDIESAVNYAYSCGKSSNIFLDNFQIFSAMVNGVNIMPTVTYDKEALETILNNLSLELPDAVVESGYYIEGNNLIITKGNDGYVIDTEATIKNITEKVVNLRYLNEIIDIAVTPKSPKEIDIDEIYKNVHKDAKDASFVAETHTITPAENGIDFNLDDAKNILKTADKECVIPLKVLYPKVTNKMIGGEAFPDLLASYSTKYAASNKNRTTNLILASKKINGTVLLPGETFSYNNVVGERTISAGYKDAAIYLNGQVVDGLGGGICQISTTLFNAVLLSNLEIVELHNHQFIPSYATAGRDATVVYGVKDFQFKNSRNYAIKIVCSVANGVASFEIWGYKQEPEYDVSISASVTSRTDTYIKSVTYRVLKLNGSVVKNEKISNYTYKVH